MAGSSRTTFKKRQKELARQDRQREKAAKRLQRKLDRQAAREHPEGALLEPEALEALEVQEAQGAQE